MATDLIKQIQEGPDHVANLAGSALTLAPIGLGAYVGFKRIQANNPVVGSQLGHGMLAEINKGVGRRLQTTSAKRDARQAAKLDELTRELLSADGVQKIINQTQKYKAVAQSLLATMGETGMGIDPQHMMNFRTQLVEIVQESLDPEQTKEVLKNLVRTVGQGDEATKSTFARYQKTFGDLNSQIVAPDFTAKASVAFNPISPERLSSKATGRYNRLLRSLGEGAKGRVETVEIGGSQYARVFSPSGKRSFQTAIPLDIRDMTFRTGESFGTTYGITAEYIDAQAALKATRAGSALPRTSFEDVVLSEFERRVGRGGRLSASARREFNAFMVEDLVALPRAMGMTGKSAAGARAHLQRATRFQQQQVTFVGMERIQDPKQQMEMLSYAVRSDPRLDPGVGPDRILGGTIRDTSGGRQYAHLALRDQGAMSVFKTGGVSDRLSMPVVSRAEQVLGRQPAFTGDTRPLGRRGVFRGGAGPAIGATEALTGTVNKAVLLDLSVQSRLGIDKKILGGLEGTGQAYGTNVGRMWTPGTITVQDPTDYKGASSRLLNRLMKLPQGEEVYLSAAELQDYQGYLGMGAQGPRFLPRDPRTRGMYIGLESKLDAHGKSLLRFSYRAERDMETGKLFGTQFKGTVANMQESQLTSMLARHYGITKKELASYGVQTRDLLATSGDMLKKAPDYLHRQMISGFGLVSGQANPFDYIAAEAAKLGGEMSKTERLTRVVARELGMRGGHREVSATAAGRVLAGVLHMKSDLSADNVESIIRGAFGKRAEDVLAVARQGVALGADAFAAGAGVGDWGLARGSLPVRGYQLLMNRLTDMGLGTNQVSDFLAGIHKNKVGFADQFKSVAGLYNLVGSMSGATGLTSQSGLKTLTIDDLVGQMMDQDGSLSKVLRQNSKGVMLDLASKRGTPVGDAIVHAAKKEFGEQALLRLPGAESLEAMRGTTIKMMGQTQQIGSRFDQQLDAFGEAVLRISQNSQIAKEEAAESFATFRKNTGELFGHAFSGLAGGKIKGSAFADAEAYILGEGADPRLTPAKQKFLAGVVSKTHGKAVFMDSKGMLSMMKDWMGKPSDVAHQLRMFYTGSEGLHASTAPGIYGVAGRTPMLSKGNIDVVQYFRDLQEVGTRGGFAWDAMKTAKVGKTTVLDMALGVAGLKGATGFSDVAKANKATQQQFFRSMAENLQSFVNWEGGGRMIQPQGFTNLKVDGLDKQVKIDIGVASAAGGDFDGDKWLAMLLNSDQRQMLKSTLQSGTSADYFARDALYKVQSEVYVQAAKQHLGTMQVAQGRLDAAEQAVQDMKKESGTKRGTGPVDLKLNHLRRSLLQNAAGNERIASEGLAMLKALQEYTVIKGKKLPIYLPFAEELGAATDSLIRGEGTGSLKQFLQDRVFGQESQIWSGVGATALDGSAPAHIRTAVSGGVANLDATLDFIEQSFSNYGASQGNLIGNSAGDIARAVRDGNMTPAVMRDLSSAFGVSSAGMISGWTDDQMAQLFDVARDSTARIRSAGSKFNMKAVGPMALGAMGSLAVSALLGDEGYSRRALDMPGSVSDGRVSDAIASGSLFNTGQTGPSAEEMMMQGSQYGQFDATINVPQTYMAQGNGYQIRGDIPGAANVREAAAYMNSLTGGFGSIRVNDMRRPITGAYADKIMGVY